jgi:hypothetical protein
MKQFLVLSSVLAASCVAGFPQSHVDSREGEFKTIPGLKHAGIRSTPSAKLRAAEVNAGSTCDDSPQSYSRWEWWNSVTINPGQAVYLDSSINYTSSDSVRVTVRSDASDLSKLVTVAYWSVSDLDFYNASEVGFGSDSYFLNTSGSIFAVFGSEFRLGLQNSGTTPIKLNSVLLITRIE